MSILINDLLNIENIKNLKVRFVQSNGDTDPIELFKSDRSSLLEWQFWNYEKKKSFRQNDVAIGFVKLGGNKWLLFDVSVITKDLNTLGGVGYEYKAMGEHAKYCGRVIIEFKNKSQNMVRRANSVLSDCKVVQILEDTFDNDTFPGYENINLSWAQLNKVIDKSTWKTALENQKGVYLITDRNNGKKYVGSAYGKNMIHGRWAEYIRTGHGGNKELRSLGIKYIKDNFRFSILDIYKSTVDDNVIIKRESWWKNTLLSREFGYNGN